LSPPFVGHLRSILPLLQFCRNSAGLKYRRPRRWPRRVLIDGSNFLRTQFIRQWRHLAQSTETHFLNQSHFAVFKPKTVAFAFQKRPNRIL
jgi:hypothetical protein